MGKTVGKRCYFDEWRIGETESWFTDMAAQGLHLKSVINKYAHFERGEAKNIRYRIDFTNAENLLGEEQRELYAQSGWEYVCDMGKSRVFRSPEALNAPEIHTDAAEQAYMLKKLGRSLKLSAILIALLMVLSVGAICLLRFSSTAPILDFLDGRNRMPMVFWVAIGGTFRAIQAAISIKKLTRSVSEGGEIDHRADWRRYRRRAAAGSLIFGVVLTLYLGVNVTSIAMRRTETLPMVSDNQMHIRLADIETDDALLRGMSFERRGVDWANYSSRWWSLLASETIEMAEHGVIPGKVCPGSAENWWPAEAMEYAPSISVKLYRLRFSQLAAETLKALCDSNRWGGARPLVEHTDYTGFDTLITRVGEGDTEVFASRANDVIYVRYYGDKDLETVIEVVCDWMENP